jgi:hypothetical protein
MVAIVDKLEKKHDDEEENKNRRCFLQLIERSNLVYLNGLV